VIRIEASKDIIEAFRKEDPKFCQFLEETGRLVERGEHKNEKNHGSN